MHERRDAACLTPNLRRNFGAQFQGGVQKRRAHFLASAARATVDAVALPVVNGATLTCSFGLAPSTLIVLPKNKTMDENAPMANIGDNAPMVNITPFGLCNSLANPVTASQTAAALGVLTPGTCTPAPVTSWVPGSPTVHVGGMPALDTNSKCVCVYGGVISVAVGLAFKTLLP